MKSKRKPVVQARRRKNQVLWLIKLLELIKLNKPECWLAADGVFFWVLLKAKIEGEGGKSFRNKETTALTQIGERNQHKKIRNIYLNTKGIIFEHFNFSRFFLCFSLNAACQRAESFHTISCRSKFPFLPIVHYLPFTEAQEDILRLCLCPEKRKDRKMLYFRTHVQTARRTAKIGLLKLSNNKEKKPMKFAGATLRAFEVFKSLISLFATESALVLRNYLFHSLALVRAFIMHSFSFNSQLWDRHRFNNERTHFARRIKTSASVLS